MVGYTLARLASSSELFFLTLIGATGGFLLSTGIYLRGLLGGILGGVIYHTPYLFLIVFGSVYIGALLSGAIFGALLVLSVYISAKQTGKGTMERVLGVALAIMCDTLVGNVFLLIDDLPRVVIGGSSVIGPIGGGLIALTAYLRAVLRR
jgi:hypothetical protein